jgi:hypothetical protein
MKIKGINGLSVQDLQDEISRGGRFVIYSYCISVIFMTFKRGTDIYFVKPDQSRFAKGLPWTMLSLLLGWWGIPWGFIYTPAALITNIGGGKNVTDEVINFIHSQTSGPVFDFEKEVTAEEEKELEKLKSGVGN